MKKPFLSLTLLLSALSTSGFSSPTSGLEIKYGTNINDLPRNSDIASKAASVVGIYHFNSSYPSPKDCTGVWISKTSLLTNNDCTFDISSGISELRAGDKFQVVFTNGKTISAQVVKVSRSINEKVTDEVKYYLGGKGLAVIEVTPPDITPSYVSEDEIIQNKVHGDFKAGFEALKRLSEILWSGDRQLYALGHYALDHEFKYSVISNYSFNEVQIYFLRFNKTDKFFDAIPTFNDLHNLEIKGNLGTKDLEFIPTSPYKSVTNSFLLNRELEEKGDRGGPVFSCNNWGNDCYLVGILSGKKGNSAVVTTLANPYFDLIR
jgi:hypothetical protein